MSITCIANNGSNGQTEVPFYDCPCSTCTKMEWELRDEDDTTKLREHRHNNFPESWDAAGKAVAK